MIGPRRKLQCFAAPGKLAQINRLHRLKPAIQDNPSRARFHRICCDPAFRSVGERDQIAGFLVPLSRFGCVSPWRFWREFNANPLGKRAQSRVQIIGKRDHNVRPLKHARGGHVFGKPDRPSDGLASRQNVDLAVGHLRVSHGFVA